MNSNTTLFWHVLLVFTAATAGVWFACQWTAAELAYSPRLGAPWFILGETPVYHPWRFFGWWYSYEAYAPHVFDQAGQMAAGGGVAAIVIGVTGSVLRARGQKHVTTYGSSRWATYRDIEEAGLYEGRGVFLGQKDGEYLRHDGPEHVMAFAPTRSGKGVGLVIPTLLDWPHSAIIHDIKSENWDLTAGYRNQIGRALRFNPTSVTSIRFNPLGEVRKGPNEVRDVQNIADILVDPDGGLERRDHWDKTAHTLLTGAILHVLYAEQNKTLSGVAEFLSDPDRDISDTLDHMLETKHFAGILRASVHPIVAQCAREVKNKTAAERSGVVSTALTFLSLYRDPVVARATSASDFQIDDLVSGPDPVSLYLAVPPSDVSRTRPLMRLMLNQIARRLTESETSIGARRQVLFMLDEFPTLGRLAFFEDSLGYMAGYGLRAFLITQSLNQIDKAYGTSNAILDNCHVRVAFATNDERTAKRISDALGTKTEQRAMKNYAGHRLAPWLSHVMVSRQETARALLTPGEIMQLPDDQELIMISGNRPILASKLRYYEDRNFIRRRVEPPFIEPDPDNPFLGLWCAHDEGGGGGRVIEGDAVDAGAAEDCADEDSGDDEEGGRERAPSLDAPDLEPDKDAGLEDDLDRDPDMDRGQEDGDDRGVGKDIRDGDTFDQSNDIGMLRPKDDGEEQS